MVSAYIKYLYLDPSPGLRPSVHVLAEYFRRLYVGSRPLHLRMVTSC